MSSKSSALALAFVRLVPLYKVKIEAYAKYYNPQSTSSNLNGFALALTAAFGVTSSSTGEALKAFNTLNSYGGIIAGSGGEGSMHPKLFVNILLFDKDFKLVDAAWQQIDGGEQVGISPKAAHDYMMQEVDVKEAGYAYIYVSNENATLVEFYVDDVVITHTPSNIIQYNEYYPFGMQTANSWTRENTTGNSFLYNEASELNAASGYYDLPYRAYDPVLGRMNGVDPLASKYASLTPYNYSNNDPVFYTDPSGAEYGVPDWMRDRIDQLPHVHGGGGSGYEGYGGMGYSSLLELPMLLTRARSGDENALNDYFNRYGTTYTIRTIDWYTNGIVDAEHYIDTEYRFVEQTQGGIFLTGTAPFSLYNGALRMYYEYSSASLRGAFTGVGGVIDYKGGSDARFRLKSNIRGLTLEPQRGILNKLDPLRATTKATPRFWKTNVGWNVAGKLSAAGGVFGLGVAGYRIANADNKLSETGKVASGFAGAWIGMQAVGPIAATAGAFSGPAAPFVTGGILLIGGAAGALGAEWIFDQF